MRALLLLAPAIIACGPSIGVTRLWPTPLEARPDDHPIAIYMETRPRCPFDEIATLSGYRPTMFVSQDQLVEGLRSRARRAGGDAILGYSTESRVTGMSSSGVPGAVNVDRTTIHRGTVIRFRDSACRE